MKKIGLVNALLLALSLSFLSLHAQPNNPAEVRGKIIGQPTNGTFKNVSVPAFNRVFSSIIEAAMVNKELALPIGFDVKIYTEVSKFQPQLGEKRHMARLEFLLFPYYINHQGVLETVDEAPTAISIQLNSDEFFTRKAGYFEHYDRRLRIPHPFQRVPTVDSTADYTEYSYKDYPFNVGYYRSNSFRILRGNDQPVFIPFSRKAYGRYQIALTRKTIQENEEKIIDFRKEIAQSQKNLKEPVFKNSQQIISNGIESLEGMIRRLQSENTEHKEQIRRYENLLSAMPEAEANAGAYVDMESMRYADSDFFHLVPYGRKEGWPLYEVNPAYYDDTQQPTKTQSIVVSYWYGDSCPAFLRKRVKQIFDHIDYHQLKESMQ